MKKIVFLEFIDEFRELQEYARRTGTPLGDFVLVAVEPELQALLRMEKIAYVDTLGLFSNDSHRALVIDTEKTLGRVRETFDFIDNRGLRTCYVNEYIHYLRLYLNHFFKMAEICRNAAGMFPDSVWYASVRDVFPGDSPLLAGGERCLGLVAQRLAASLGATFVNLHQTGCQKPCPKAHDAKAGRAAGLLARVTLFTLRRRKVICIPYGGSYFKQLLGETAAHLRGISYLYLNDHYTVWGMLAVNLVSWLRYRLGLNRFPYAALNLLFLAGDQCACSEEKRLLACLQRVKLDEDSALWQYRGVNGADFFRAKCSAALDPLLLKMLRFSRAIESLCRLCPASMVMSYSGLGLMSVAQEYYRRKDKVSLFISHACHPEPVDAVHEVELLNLGRAFMLSDYSHAALSLPVQERHLRYFKARYPWVDNREVLCGPLVFSRFTPARRTQQRAALGFSESDFVIVHATTTKARYGERFYFLETFDELFSSLSDLVAMADSLPAVRLVFRIHPGFALSDGQIRELLPVSASLSIHRQGDFVDVLAAADLVVSYSSTAIDEALLNALPVLLYDKWKRYNHFRSPVFAKGREPECFPVCYVNDAGLLRDAVLSVIARSKGKGPADFAGAVYAGDYRDGFYRFINNSFVVHPLREGVCASPVSYHQS